MFRMKSIFSWLLLFVITLVNAQDSTLLVGTGVEVNPYLFGVNEVWTTGDVLYNADELIQAARSTRVGGLRFPGGTVANYWDIKGANYVPNCDASACKQFGARVNSHPAGTFSIEHFLAGVNKASKAASPIMVLNLLTLTSEEAALTLDFLKNQSIAVPYIELGNEYYLINQYGTIFPTADVYMNKATQTIQRGRALFPQSQQAATANYYQMLHSDWTAWNKDLAKYTHLVDAVTIHDYNLSEELLKQYPEAEWPSVSTAATEAAFMTIIPGTQKFGSHIKLWMTEYNMEHQSTLYPNVKDGGLRALYMVAHQLVGVNNNDIIKVMQLHSFLSYKGIGWDQDQGIVAIDPTAGTTEVNTAAEVLAFVSHIALENSNLMHPLTVKGGPTLNITIYSHNGLTCLYGSAFSNQTSKYLALVLINRCNAKVNANYTWSGVKYRQATITTYSGDPSEVGGHAATPVYSEQLPWNKPEAPTSKVVSIPAGAMDIQFSVPGINLLVAELEI